MEELKIGICQVMPVDTGKMDNIEKARSMINNAAEKGAKIVALPEMFNCPYDNKYFRDYAETCISGETIEMLSSIAKEKNIYIIGGSIPELGQDDKVYNTSFIFNDKGSIIGKHRKIHLFDIDIKNKISFKESEVLSAGNSITLVDTPWCKIGVAICYDIRFPELIRIMALRGAKIIFIPAAFSMTTGAAHWDILYRTRAVDNQVYVVGISPAKNPTQSYLAYGNSLIVDPWGKIINKLGDAEALLIENINLDYLDEVREALPVIRHRREDIYRLESM